MLAQSFALTSEPMFLVESVFGHVSYLPQFKKTTNIGTEIQGSRMQPWKYHLRTPWANQYETALRTTPAFWS